MRCCDNCEHFQTIGPRVCVKNSPANPMQHLPEDKACEDYELKRGEWVKPEDVKPFNGELVLVKDENGITLPIFGYRSGDMVIPIYYVRELDGRSTVHNPEYWMRIPKQPEEEKKT